MEKRIGTINIIIYNTLAAEKVNKLLSQYGEFVLSRNGLPLRERNLHIITIIIEASTDIINSLTGQLGRIKDVEVKCLISKCKIEETEEQNIIN